METNVPPCVNRGFKLRQGMIELTEGYIKLTEANLFDVNSNLTKEQVKEIYCKLERRYAEAVQGDS